MELRRFKYIVILFIFMTNYSNEEHVILKFGEERVIRYIKNGKLFISDDTPTEIIGSAQLNTVEFYSCVWDNCKFSIPNTIKTLVIDQSIIKIPDFFDNFPMLENLYISDTFGFSLEVLRNIKTLKILAFTISEIEKIEYLANLTNLQELYLNNNKISCIEGLENLEQLTLLDLSNNKIEKIENIDHLSNLRELFLSSNLIQKFEDLENLKNLKILDLEENKISKIEGIENLTNLEELTLRNNEFPFKKLSREEATPYFARLKKLKYLNADKYPNTDSYRIRTDYL